jgi:hypothetical protein
MVGIAGEVIPVIIQHFAGLSTIKLTRVGLL